MNKNVSFWRLSIAFLGLALLSGCASLQNAGKTTEEIVTERANQRRVAVIAGDAEKAYSFLAPSVREVITLNRYRGMLAAAAKREYAETVNVTCEEERCEVRMKIGFTSPMHRKMGVMETHVTERWVLEDGRWWFYQRP
jgi:hypothetical protein